MNFLQGQLTNDTTSLDAKHAMLAGYLNPQGRVLALIYLLPHSSGTLAIMPRELLQSTADRLRKFVLRAKVKIDVPGEALQVYGYHGTEALTAATLPVPTEDAFYVERDGVGVARVARSQNRFWMVGAASSSAQDTSEQSAEAPWRRADVEAGLPQVYGATSEAFVAQMLNLDLLDAISFKKGCYTGQEIVARTQHLGRIKRRLFRLRLPPGNWQIGDEVRLSDGRVGRLTEVVDGDEGSEALAVLPLHADTEDAVDPDRVDTDARVAPALGADSGFATLLPLPYALTSR